MRRMLSGVLVGVVAFVVAAPVFAWIMPHRESPPSAASDGERLGPTQVWSDPAGDAPAPSPDAGHGHQAPAPAPAPGPATRDGYGILSIKVDSGKERPHHGHRHHGDD